MAKPEFHNGDENWGEWDLDVEGPSQPFLGIWIWIFGGSDSLKFYFQVSSWLFMSNFSTGVHLPLLTPHWWPKILVWGSAVTIIVVTIFIAIFQNYRIFIAIFPVRVERYICTALALCKHDRFTTSLLKFQHASVTCRERRDTCDSHLATVAEQRLRPCKMPQLPLKYRVTGGLRGGVARSVFMTSQLTITSVCLRYGFQVSVLSLVWMEN